MIKTDDGMAKQGSQSNTRLVESVSQPYNSNVNGLNQLARKTSLPD